MLGDSWLKPDMKYFKRKSFSVLYMTRTWKLSQQLTLLKARNGLTAPLQASLRLLLASASMSVWTALPWTLAVISILMHP